MRLGQLELVKGYSSRLLVDKTHGVVWRYGWGEQAKKVIHNYQWLQQAHAVIPVPQPFAIRRLGPLVVTSESFVDGQPLTTQEINSEIIASIIKTIAPLYQRYGQGKEGEYVSLIHGDLTHRNILSSSHGFYFIDGDHPAVTPPEFDIWLLIADTAVHATGQASHRLFLQQIKATKPTDRPYHEATQHLYQLVPAARANESHADQLWTAFFERCKEHSIQDCLRRKKSLDFLDDLE